MPTKTVNLYGDPQGTIQADTSAASSTLAMRDSSGGLAAAALQGSSVSTSGTFAGAPSSQTGNFTAGAATDYICNATSGAITATLPPAASAMGRIYTFVKTDNVNNVTVKGNGSELVNGANTSVISTQYGKLTAISDGTQWWIKG